MTGRGNGERRRMIPGNPDAPVKLSLSLSTSPAQLDSTSEEPFYVVITAHNPSDKAITFNTHVTPFASVRWGGYENMICTMKPDKVIDIWPRAWPKWYWESENLPHAGMLTVPAHGSVSEKLEVPRAAIEAAEIVPGERYRTRLTLEYNGCSWWTYGTLCDLEGVRLRLHREDDPYEDPDALEPAEWLETYGDGPWTTGMSPDLLCMVRGEDLEFEVK